LLAEGTTRVVVDSANARLTITENTFPAAAVSLHCAVWSKADQSDIRWPVLQKVGSNVYQNTFPMPPLGHYYVHTYAKCADGRFIRICETTYEV